MIEVYPQVTMSQERPNNMAVLPLKDTPVKRIDLEGAVDRPSQEV